MRYATLLTAATLATFATAVPLDKRDENAAADAGVTDYGSYGAYGAYGSYGQYDSVKATSSEASTLDEPSQQPPPSPPSAPSPPPGTSFENFVAISTRSGDINLHLRPISANGQRFYINKDTSTYCPLPDCSSYVNYTVFSARPNDATSSLGLFTNVPGGQATFVTDDGQLGYTQPHSGSSPSGSVNAPFQYTPGTSPGSVGTLNFKYGNWVACPVPDQGQVYQLFASAAPNFSKTDCLGIGLGTSPYTGRPAYQYN